ncbi:unnamed protein product, partial [Darwinula stevensoni]
MKKHLIYGIAIKSCVDFAEFPDGVLNVSFLETVDDGTGCILCILRTQSTDDMGDTKNIQTNQHDKCHQGNFSLGDLVLVRGNPQMQRDEHRILVTYH